MKRFTHRSIGILVALALLTGLNQAVSAQMDTTRNYGIMLIGNPHTLLNTHLLNTKNGELYLGKHSPRRMQTNELHITGSYVGVEGSKLYVSVIDNSNTPNTRGYLDIVGTATQRGLGTLIDLDYTNSDWGWDGSCIDLVRANKEGSNAGTFYFPAHMSPMNNRIPVLRVRMYANDMIWYIAEKLVDDSHTNLAQSVCLNDMYINPELTVKLLTNPVNCTYQWYRCEADGSNFVYLGSDNGAQTPTYTPPVTTAGTSYYRCVVTSLTCVYNTDTTAVSEITVGAPVQILQHPVSAVIPRDGTTHITLSVVATGANLTYQWYKNNVAMAGEINSDLTVALADNNAMDDYYVEVSGCDATLRSETATVGYCLDLIVQIRNHTLTVNNNSETNGGYTFSHYAWYKDGDKIWEGTPDQKGNYYYTGTADLDPNAEYMVILKDNRGREVTSCTYIPVMGTPTTEIRVYPTIVSSRSNEPVYVEVITESDIVEDADIDIYTIRGWNVGTFKSHNRMTEIQLPNVAGVYILKYKSVSGVEHEVKVIVK